MSDDVIQVNLEGKTIFLVGTAHISKKSVDIVREVIEKENPDAIAVELCEQRKTALLNEKRWDETEITDVIKSGRTQLFLSQLFLANFQRKLGDKVGVKPGVEMLEAVKIGHERGIKVELVDRDVKTTLTRAQQQIGFVEKLRLLYSILGGLLKGEDITEEAIEELKDKDVISELLDELSKNVPSLKNTLVDERDKYIAYKILQSDAKKIVAVIGAGHVQGVTKILENTQEKTDLKKQIKLLETVEKKKGRMKYVAYAIPVLFFFIVLWSFLRHDIGFTLSLLTSWFLINGTLSAIGAALALAHPLSIATAFVVAPITSLNPTIAAGWFAGFVELKMRKPRVKDFNGMFKLNRIRDYWGNRITRILLVIVFANLGSSAGTVIALPYLAALI